MTLLGGLIDWDGTIVKTPERQFKWFKEWARQNHKSFDFKTVDEFLPLYNKLISEAGAQGVYDHLGLPCDIDNLTHPVWIAYNNFKSQNPVEAYDGITDALVEVWKIGRLGEDTSRNQAMRLAINTTNDWSSIYPDLARFGIDHIFDSYCTAETLHTFVGDGGKAKSVHKPSKVSVALMLNILGTDGHMTFHLGDTVADLRASYDVRKHGSIRSENLITIGAAWGFESREELLKGYASKDSGTIHFIHIIDHPSELPNIIRQYK